MRYISLKHPVLWNTLSNWVKKPIDHSFHPCVTALAKFNLVGFRELSGLRNSLPTSKTKTLGEIWKINKSWLPFFILTQHELPPWLRSHLEVWHTTSSLLSEFLIQNKTGQILVTLVQMSVHQVTNLWATRAVTQGWQFWRYVLTQ